MSALLKDKINFGLEDMSTSQILVSGYFVIILTGTLLLMLPSATTQQGSMRFINALFTATSATCVTGLIVVTTASAFTVFGQIVIMLLIQIGGLGIMTMSTLVAFIIGKKITLKERLIIQEDLNQFNISGLVRLIRYVIGFTLFFEGIGAFIMFFRLIKEYNTINAIYLSVFHAVSAFNNAGFDLFGNSLESFTGDITINFVVMILIIMGGIGFGVVIEISNFNKFKHLSLQTKMVLFISIFLIIFGMIVIFGFEFTNPETMGNLKFGDKVLSSLFLSVTPRTAGFNTVPTGSLRSSTLFFIIVLMFIGASPGSTGGGIKTTTFGVMAITLWNLMIGKKDMEVFNRQLEKDVIYKAISIAMISTGLVIFVTLFLLITENALFLDILFETVSAFGTVGLSTGVTPTLSDIGRVLITFTMFAGRVGPLTFAVAFAEKERKGIYHYPTEDIMVG
ncbi:MAG: TrkH family potassium uptake protein [Halanaerobiales bacterium]|nr:TrkH family potassium uptake protein [Halanaerobiales bacterium]